MALKRASNLNRKARRQRSWLRGEARHKRNREANDARRDANIAALKALGGTIQNKTFERIDKVTGKVRIITKRESPSEALARTKREQG